MPGICATPGCTDPVYRDAHGKVGKYCRRSHKLWGKKGCLLCRRAEGCENSEFCGPCRATVGHTAPTLVRVPEDNERYNDIASKFQKSWRHPTRCPKVHAIYRVITGGESADVYYAYRDMVEVRGGFTAMGLPPGNQRLRWHGTNRNCNVGDSGRTSLCCSPHCSLCRIIKTSFNVAHSKKKTGCGRFGQGIYTSSTSSKSNDYSKNLVSSPWKAVLLAYVVVGNAKKFTTNQPTLTKPPVGFDSVIGEPSLGGSLNYDELVVYNNTAVHPGYLVMYRS